MLSHRVGIIALAALVGMIPASPSRAFDIQRVESPAGVTAWLVEDRSLPVISLSFLAETGSADDPKGKAGLSSMTAYLLDEGAGDYDATAFQERVEGEALRMSFDVGRDTFSGSLRCLSAHHEKAFDLFALALGKPRFDADAIERVRGQMLSTIARHDQDPSATAQKAWFAEAFADHPYARPSIGTATDLPRLSRDDIRRRHRQMVRAPIHIAVAGDISAKELAALLDRVFPHGDQGSFRGEKGGEESMAKRGVVRIERNIPQSSVMFGMEGLGRRDPDYHALRVLNYTLGGGSFNARLMQEIREKRGLVYSVHSWLAELRHAPLLLGFLATENARLDTALDILRREISTMARDSITEAELEAAKTYLIQSLPLKLDSIRSIARMLAAIRYYDLGIDYLDRRQERIRAVDAAAVRRVARRVLRADQMLIVVVGGRPQAP